MANKVVIAVVIGFASIKLFSFIRRKAIARRHHKRAQQKRAERDAKKFILPEVEKSKQDYILSLHAYELAEAIKSGKVTAVEATSTYISRAYTLGRKFGLTTEEPYEAALELAYLRDKQLKENPESCGILHGVPISLKDIFSQKGCCSTAGLACKLTKMDTHDCFLLEILKDEGAIPFARSNIPQALMWMETDNDIYGRGDNPWNPEFSTGGSSGGEAGLLACRASPLGIGSDIGGSIRIPSSFCGVYGFKTTAGRVSTKNVMVAHPSGVNPFNFVVKSVSGPMARCVKDMELVLKAWWQEKYFSKDFALCPLEFNQEMYNNTYKSRSLRIGYYFDLDNFECCPAVRRGVRECRDALKKLGHTLVEFHFPNSKKALNLYMRNVSACGSQVLLDAMQGEEPASFYKPGFFLVGHPWIKKIIMKILELTNNQRLYDLLNINQNLTPAEYIALFREINEYVQEFTNYWQSLQLDAVISPAYGTVATPHAEGFKVASSLIYSTVWNLLGYPAGVIPVGIVRENETEYISKVNDLLTKNAKGITKNSSGLPIGVHVASLPYRDEIALGVMKQIEDEINFHQFAF